MPESDKSLPANSKDNLDRKLDHAVEETFPTSDPVSVQITKGGAIEYDDAGNPLSQGGAEAPGYIAQATEAFGSATSAASEVAREAYEQGSQYARSAFDQGSRYAREAADRYPQAERYYQQSRRVVRDYTPEIPMLTLLLGAAVGYGIAWIIHHRSWRDERPLPDYARTRQGFKPYRT
jgi:hypothetical protein